MWKMEPGHVHVLVGGNDETSSIHVFLDRGWNLAWRVEPDRSCVPSLPSLIPRPLPDFTRSRGENMIFLYDCMQD